MTARAKMYYELHCKTNYSFLTGGSHADELVERAIELGYRGLAVTDENTLAGVVRAYAAARESNEKAAAEIPNSKFQPPASNLRPPNLKLIIGAEIIPNDGPPILLWAPDRAAYADLSRLITLGRRRATKGECWLSLDDIAKYSQRLLAGVIPYFQGDRLRTDHIDKEHPSYDWHFGDGNSEFGMRKFDGALPNSEFRPPTSGMPWELGMHKYREMFGDRAYLMASLYRGVDDGWRIEQLYHTRARLPLHDVLTAIKHRTTVASAGDLLLPNADRHLQTIEHRQAAFAQLAGAVERTSEVADRCDFLS